MDTERRATSTKGEPERKRGQFYKISKGSKRTQNGPYHAVSQLFTNIYGRVLNYNRSFV